MLRALTGGRAGSVGLAASSLTEAKKKKEEAQGAEGEVRQEVLPAGLVLQ